MEGKELKELAETLKKETDEFKRINSEYIKSLEGKADAKTVADLRAELKASDEKIQTLSSQLEEFGTKQKEAGNRIVKSIDEMIIEGAKGLSDKIKVRGFKHNFELKTGTPLTTLADAGGLGLDTAVIPANRLPGVGRTPDRQPMLLDILPSATTTGEQVTWVERTARTDGAAGRIEGAVMGESLYTYELKKSPIEIISHFTKVTTRMLNDAGELINEIKTEHIEQLRRKLDAYLLTGTGTTPQLHGITHACPAYTNTDLNTSIPAANLFDAVLAAMNQVENYQYVPTHVFLHPSDANGVAALKSNTAEYLNVMINGQMHGLRVIKNTGITKGYMLCGDMTKGTIFYKGGVKINIWDQNESDPIYGLATITSELEAGFRIRVCDYNAWVYDTIANIINAITV